MIGLQVPDAAPPAAVGAPGAIAPFDRTKLNLMLLIGHGPAAEMDRLSAAAAAAGFPARHAQGPTGDEIMVVFNGAQQAQAWRFTLEAEAGRHGRLRFERGYLPPAVVTPASR